jgi:hypothetical protein
MIQGKLLKEDGSFLLLEDGGAILLELLIEWEIDDKPSGPDIWETQQKPPP